VRTTLTLDDDVAALIRRAQAKRRAPMKAIVNEALRVGLARETTPARQRVERHTTAVSLGRCLIGSLDDVAEALAVAEGERFR